MKRFAGIFILLMMLFLSLKCICTADGNELFQITVLDVGKGDCILVQTGENTVMIDTGYKADREKIVQYLASHNISRLDALIISHFHKDHVGGAAGILEKIPVGMVYMPDYEGTRDTYLEMMKVIQNKGIPAQRLTADVSFQLNGAEYTIYPSAVPYDAEAENDNDVSMAATVKFSGHSAFFAGDLEEAGITAIADHARALGLDLRSDIIKLPHHGRTSNNSDVLLDMVNPKIALITDGSSERAYGEMIDNLTKRNCEYHCSAADGTFIIKADGASGYTYVPTKEDDDVISGPWSYTIQKDGSAAITGYTGKDQDLIIPSEIDGKPVTAVAASAFYNHTKLKSVTVPESVNEIGDSAFAWCTGLKSITLPKQMTSLGAGCFAWCTKLAGVELPDGIKSIGEYTFFHCKNLEGIEVPDSVTSIGEKAFSNCGSLASVKLPSGLKNIEEDVFKKCKNLKNVVIPDGVKKIRKSAFVDCDNLEEVTIPASVTAIEASAFKGCKSLSDIYFEGTEDMWNLIAFGENWDSETPSGKTIHFKMEPEPDPDPEPEDFVPAIGFYLLRGTGLPATGIASAAIPPKPYDLKYEDLGLTIEIPSISSKAEIVAVPYSGSEYPVTWLGDFAGLLEGFALPGEGTTVIAGHNHLDLETAGPFAFLGNAETGDRVFVRSGNNMPQIYSVFANEKIGMNDWEALEAVSASKDNALILMTCEDERSDGIYESRRIIAAEEVVY